MKGLWLRSFLASVLTTVALWQIYEWVWLPYAYDLETRALENELQIRANALRQRFAELEPSNWSQAVDDYNQSSDDLLQLVSEADPDWVDLYAGLIANGTSGIQVNGEEMVATVLLSDQRTLLHNEAFYLEISDSFEAALWLFVMAALVLAGAALWWTLKPVAKRLSLVADSLENIQHDVPSDRLTVYGTGPLGRVEAAHNRASKALRERMQEFHESISGQRDLMHAVAHEFRSPISRLRFAQDMLMDCEDPQEKEGLVKRMDEAIEELDELVTEVLGYSRIRHGGISLKTSQFDINDSINSALEKTRLVYPAIKLRSRAISGDGLLVGDPKLSERAIINVVRNAARFARTQVLLESERDGQNMIIRVSDDGPGIAPGKRERIFEPFTRLDASRSRDSGGSGLGLAIVHAIMSRHGGSVHCQSSELGGALFILSWPLRPLF